MKRQVLQVESHNELQFVMDLIEGVKERIEMQKIIDVWDYRDTSCILLKKQQGGFYGLLESGAATQYYETEEEATTAIKTLVDHMTNVGVLKSSQYNEE